MWNKFDGAGQQGHMGHPLPIAMSQVGHVLLVGAWPPPPYKYPVLMPPSLLSTSHLPSQGPAD